MWCHAPFGFIDGLTDFGKHFGKAMTAGIEYVFVEAVGTNIDLAVILPFIGIANFIFKGCQLHQSLGLGGFAHPIEGLDAHFESKAQVLYHFADLGFGIFAEMLCYKKLA